MSTGVITWSQTAASNGSADTSVNFAEGMAPSAVNDSARGLMASVAKWRDDISGAIVTTGSSTAYAVTSYQVQAALTAGYVIAFNPHTTNGATVTLNVDSLGAKPLRSAPGVELAAGVLVQGTPYVATYFTSNSGEWILEGFYGNPYNVPIGGGMIYLGATAPNSNFVFPYGQALNRTTYATLFAQCGTSFGSGDGSSTFNIVDLRGRLPVGKDDMGGTAANRVTSAGSGISGTTMGATGGAETHALTTAEMPAHDHGGTVGNTAADIHGSTQTSSTNDGGRNHGFLDNIVLGAGVGPLYGATDQHTHTITSQGGDGAHLNMQPSVIVPWIIRII